MFIKLRGKQYLFHYAEVDAVKNIVLLYAIEDDDLLEMEVGVEGNVVEALQVLASSLSKYNIFTDIDKDLKMRGLYVKSVYLTDKQAVKDPKHLVGVTKSTYLDDIVGMYQGGLVLITEIVQTDLGIHLIHTKGSTCIFKRDEVTDITFEYTVDELQKKQQSKEIFVFS